MLKVISWNLKNIGANKLKNTFSLSEVAQAGLGNNVNDYILNVVMGNSKWNSDWLDPASPCDLFVVIELVTGGNVVGNPVNGTALPTLATLKATMNAASPNPTAYKYKKVDPLITGNNECVGIIYNEAKLTWLASNIVQDSLGNTLAPRGPFIVQFRDTNNNIINVVGIHAPPPGGAGVAPTLKFQQPIDYSEKLADLPHIKTPPGPANPPLPASIINIVVGDFNCCPLLDYYVKPVPPNDTVTAFNELFTKGYVTTLPNNTLSSLKTGGTAQVGNYKANAYDNICFVNYDHQNVIEGVPDLIALNPRYAPNIAPATMKSIMDNYWVVSDHLPVIAIFE